MARNRLCRSAGLALLASLVFSGLAYTIQQSRRPRARELNIAPGVFEPGPLNAITDVAGVQVGHYTLVEGDDIRTGATAILPRAGNVFQEKLPAAVVIGNAFGKLAGSTQVEELGQLETPILLTNTLNVWEAAAALVEYSLAFPGNEEVRSVNPVVAETNDGYLNDIRQRPLRVEHFRQAIENARSGPVQEGSVGAGTGTMAFGFKGGIGTASRRLPEAVGEYTTGVLVQTNFGGILTIDGAPVGKELGRYAFQSLVEAGDGSCVIVVATDAPLNARQLKRLGRRALAGMARTGSSFSHGSGDYVIVFSTAESMRIPYTSREPTQEGRPLRDDRLSPLFQAVAEATEEAIYNSLLQATTVVGREGHTGDALPLDALTKILEKYRKEN